MASATTHASNYTCRGLYQPWIPSRRKTYSAHNRRQTRQGPPPIYRDTSDLKSATSGREPFFCWLPDFLSLPMMVCRSIAAMQQARNGCFIVLPRRGAPDIHQHSGRMSKIFFPMSLFPGKSDLMRHLRPRTVFLLVAGFPESTDDGLPEHCRIEGA